MTAEIRGECSVPGCAGTVVFVPLGTSVGAAGECDECGASFRLVGGEATLILPPKLKTWRSALGPGEQ